jgi:hypothetical protein
MTDKTSPLIEVPADLEAERATLGAILIHNEHFDAVAQLLSATDFFRSAHRTIFRRLAALIASRSPVDFVTLKQALASSGELDDCGGPVYLASLADGVPHSINACAYAQIVRDKSELRDYLVTIDRVRARLAKAGSVTPEALSELRVLPVITRGAPPPLLDDAAIVNLPEPVMLVPGRVPSRALVALVGDSSIGKTFVALGFALSVASRSTWLGAPIAKAGRAVYVAAEGAPAARIGAWKLAHGFDLDTSLGLHVWSGAIQLLEHAEVTRFIAAVRPLQPVMVVFDTLARCLVGGDENSAKDMGLAVAALDRVRIELDTTVVVLHHTNRAGTGERGSGALRGACDAMLTLTKADDLLQLSCTKQKDAEPFEPIDLRIVPAYPGAASCIVRLASEVTALDTLSDAQGKALHVLREVFGDQGASSAEWEASLPGVSRATFYRARKVLVDEGYVSEKQRRFQWTGKAPVSRSLTLVSRPADAASQAVAGAVS